MAIFAGLRARRSAPRDGTRRPSQTTSAAKASWLERNVPSVFRVKRLELILFSRQMATFIRAGVPILEGIRVVRDQAGSRLFRRTLDDVAGLLESGEPLSAALAKHPKVFSELYVDMVIAAEATGELDVILDQLAKYLDRAEVTSRRVRQATLYPSIVLGLAAVVIFVLITFVLPSFVRLFEDFDAELPLPTQVLLVVGAFGERYGVPFGAGVLLVAVLLYLARNTLPVRWLRTRLALRLPIVGPLVRLGIATRFARTLGILLRAGVPVAQAFQIAIAGTGNDVYRRRLGPVRDALIAGEGITGPLRDSGLFGPLLIQMVKVGEETGTLDRYLEEAANFMDDDLDYRTKQMVTVIEPLMIVGVAIVVGFVALSVVTPMYGILRSIR
jgi:type IV pilus assembly protein PilC